MSKLLGGVGADDSGVGTGEGLRGSCSACNNGSRSAPLREMLVGTRENKRDRVQKSGTYIAAGVDAGGKEKVESGTMGIKQFPIRLHRGQRNSPFSSTIKSSP